MSNSNRKTTAVSYRIDSRVLNEIIKESNLKETSTNILVNQVLRKYVEFDRYQQRLGIVPVPKQLLMDMIESCDDIQIKLIAERTFRTLRDAVIFMQKGMDLEAFLHVLEEYVKVSGIASDHVVTGSRHIFVVQHDMGFKWSEFVKALLSIIFEKVADQRAHFELTESSVVATVDLPERIQEQFSV